MADLAFYSVRDLGELIRTGQLTSVELTTLCLERLKRYDSRLFCVVTLTEDLALSQSARADAELAAGTYRGPLHGIPYGIKDLFATKKYRTTWGAAPYEDQVIDEDAFVVQRLEQAGAVLVAKLSSGVPPRRQLHSSPTTGGHGRAVPPGESDPAGLPLFVDDSDRGGGSRGGV